MMEQFLYTDRHTDRTKHYSPQTIRNGWGLIIIIKARTMNLTAILKGCRFGTNFDLQWMTCWKRLSFTNSSTSMSVTKRGWPSAKHVSNWERRSCKRPTMHSQLTAQCSRHLDSPLSHMWSSRDCIGTVKIWLVVFSIHFSVFWRTNLDFRLYPLYPNTPNKNFLGA